MFTVIELTMSASVAKTPVMPVPGLKNVSLGKPVTVSSFWSGRPELDAKNITDGNMGSMWASAEKERSGTVTVELGQNTEVSAVNLSDAPYGRIKKFDIEVEVGKSWKRVASGTTIGGNCRVNFDPIKTQRLRIQIRQASDTPTLANLEVLGE
jgi:alpha-L-fucosidase